MLTCIARSKQGSDDQSQPIDHHHHHQQKSATKLDHDATTTKHAIKILSSQIKDMALKASGAYRHCTPCSNQPTKTGGETSCSAAASEKFRWSYSYRRTASLSGRKELEARLKGISNGEGTPASASGGPVEPIVFVEENEPKEWVAQVESGVLITFVSLPRGGNDLKRIRFSLEMFTKYQAQRWWAENAEEVMELHNVRRLNLQAFPLPTTPRSEDDTTTSKNSPVTPPLGKEPLPRTLSRPNGQGIIQCSSSDSLDRQLMNSRSNYGSCDAASTPKLSSIDGAKTETSPMDASTSTANSSRDIDRDRSGDISVSNATDLETEWVEEDEPGVYLTIRASASGRRELRCVRFSREKYGELHARLWWEENRARIHKQYL